MTVLEFRSPGPSRLDDLSLIRRVSGGDRAAFDQLYRRYYPRLERYLSRTLRSRDLADEVLNDVMFAVWKGAPGFREGSKVSTWIFGIAYRQAMKAIRKQQRTPLPMESAELEAETPPDPGHASRSNLQLTLARALRVLSLEQRAVVELTFQHGYSYPEIARIVDCPVNTVKTRMFHARRLLRRFLEKVDTPPAGDEEVTTS